MVCLGYAADNKMFVKMMVAELLDIVMQNLCPNSILLTCFQNFANRIV